MSGPKIAAIYGLIPNKLGLCGPRQDLLRKFITGQLSIPQTIPVLEKFEAAYPYYQLIAKKNRISSPFNKRVVEAYWLGNNLLNKVKISDLRQLIVEKFSGPGRLPKKLALEKAAKIPDDSRPHHSFHVMVLGSITGSIDFTNKVKLQDTCRIGWGRIQEIKKNKIVVGYNPLVVKKTIDFGRAKKKELIWDKDILPSVKIGDWISFHWNYAMQILNEENIINLHKYTQGTLNSLLPLKK